MCEQHPVYRRKFLGSAAVFSSPFMFTAHLLALQDAVMDIPVSASPDDYEKVQWRYKSFPMTLVRMRDGLLKNAVKINRR
jgi:hypothetical protein